MTQKQIMWTIVCVIVGIMAIFLPYEVGKWVIGNTSCVIITWFSGVFTMAIGIGGVALGMIGYEMYKGKL